MNSKLGEMSSLAKQLLIIKAGFSLNQSAKNTNKCVCVPLKVMFESPRSSTTVFKWSTVSFKEVANDCGVESCSLKCVQWLYHDLRGEGRYVIDGCEMPRKNINSRKNYLFQQRNCELN